MTCLSIFCSGAALVIPVQDLLLFQKARDISKINGVPSKRSWFEKDLTGQMCENLSIRKRDAQG